MPPEVLSGTRRCSILDCFGLSALDGPRISSAGSDFSVPPLGSLRGDRIQAKRLAGKAVLQPKKSKEFKKRGREGMFSDFCSYFG